MIVKIFQTITHIKLQGIEFYQTPYFTLTSNQDVKKEHFSNTLFEKAIGSMRYAKIQTDYDFIFSILKSNDLFDEKDLNQMLGENIDLIHQYANGLASCLWFIKDNSVNISEIYGNVIDGGSNSFLCMSPITVITNCHGDTKEVLFNRSEIDNAYLISKQYVKICPQKEEEFGNRITEHQFSNHINTSIIKGENDNINYNKFNRIERAIKFLHIVRETSYLPRKIAMYMPIFECLFSTEPHEVTMKVSERVAFYIRGEDKKKVYKIIKEAYNLRSRYLHGEELPNNQKERTYQLELATQIDGIARYVLTRVIMEDSEKFLLKKSDFENWLTDIIFQNG